MRLCECAGLTDKPAHSPSLTRAITGPLSVKNSYFFFQINLDDLNNRLNDLEKITVSIIVMFCCVQV